jgi:hypothetical protein
MYKSEHEVLLQSSGPGGITFSDKPTWELQDSCFLFFPTVDMESFCVFYKHGER